MRKKFLERLDAGLKIKTDKKNFRNERSKFKKRQSNTNLKSKKKKKGGGIGIHKFNTVEISDDFSRVISEKNKEPKSSPAFDTVCMEF